jgi:hypothetical protein
MINRLKEQLLGYYTRIVTFLKQKLLGPNNERLDFIMDSFYKLPPNYQSLALLGVIAGVGVVVMLIFSIYFTQINSLERDLTSGFDALRRMRVLAQEYTSEKERLDWLLKSVGSKTGSLRPKPFLEEKANQLGIVLEGLKSEEVDIPQDNPLSHDFMYVNVDFRLPKISIPRMLKFFEEIERADKGLSIRNLQIRARYGDKLFFDVQARLTGLKVRSKI